MDLHFSAEDLAFRDRVRAFLAENLAEATRRASGLTTAFLHEPDVSRPFHRALHRVG